jgi:hypothetical protein
MIPINLSDKKIVTRPVEYMQKTFTNRQHIAVNNLPQIIVRAYNVSLFFIITCMASCSSH